MSRKIMLDILNKIIIDKGYSNIVINDYLKKIDVKDRDLVINVVYGTLQNLMQIDYLIEKVNASKLKPWFLNLMRLSLYQSRFLDRIPDYAITSEALKICNKKDKYFVNLFKGIFENAKKVDFSDEIHIKYSCPLWIYNLLKKQYSENEAIKCLKSFNEKPNLTIRINAKQTSFDGLKNELNIEKGLLASNSAYLKTNNLINENYLNGEFSISDEGSQYVVDILDPKEGRVLDMCAAPGSKTCAILEKSNVTLYANDIFKHKIKLINDNLKRLNLEAKLSCQDALDLKFDFLFDQILLDAPCSGLGVLGRKPEIRYTKKASDLDNILLIQSKLLDHAFSLLKVNGELVYSTCTLNKKENNMQIKKFIEKYPNMEIIFERTLMPYEYHQDGFYICKLTKR